MGFLDKLFGTEDEEKPRERADGKKPERAPAQASAAPASDPPPASAGRAAPPEEAPEEKAGKPVGGVLVSRADARAINSLVQYLERMAVGVEQAQEGVKTLIGMVQAVAKSSARADVERKQEALELRAHITTETDRLIDSMREEARGEASVAVFRALLPALDEVDHVLRENEAGAEVRAESIRIVRRRLRDALSRMGIDEIPITHRETTFDAQLHEGRPHEGEAEAVAGLPAHVIVDVERNGWTGFGKVLRHALVIVVKE